MTKNVVNNEALIYRKIEDTIHAYTNIYCYNFIKGDLDNLADELYKINSDNNKYYTINTDGDVSFKGSVLGSKADLIAAENLSLIINILKEFGLDPIINISIKKDTALLTYLDYLLLDYEVVEEKTDNFDDYCFTVKQENLIYAIGGNNNNKHLFAMNIANLIDTLRDDFENFNDLDVFIIANTAETELKANMLLQDLRLNNVKTAVCYENIDTNQQKDVANNYKAHQLIILNDEDLQKGLIIVEDNLTKESKRIAEDEIVDYILSLL